MTRLFHLILVVAGFVFLIWYMFGLEWIPNLYQNIDLETIWTNFVNGFTFNIRRNESPHLAEFLGVLTKVVSGLIMFTFLIHWFISKVLEL